jgi:hypothetical protein
VRVGEVLHSSQRLLESGPRFPIGGARQRLVPGLPEIGHRLLPLLSPQGMVGEHGGGGRQHLGKVGLQHLHDVVMGLPAHPLQHRRVGGLLDERMLKHIDGLGGLPALVQQLRRH